MDAVYTPIFKRGRGESIRASDVSGKYSHDVLMALRRFAADEAQFWQRCKRAAILFDWLAGVEVGEIEIRYTHNPFQGAISYGDIMRIVDSSRFHLRSAHQIFSAIYPDQPAFLLELGRLLDRIEYGLPAEALPLTEVWAMSRGQYLALFEAGCRTKDDVEALSFERLVELTGQPFAAAMRDIPPSA